MSFTEKAVIEDFIINELVKLGWRYVEPENLERASIDEPLLINSLKRAIKRINSDVNLSDRDLESIVNMLRFRPPTSEGIKEVLHWFKNGVPYKPGRRGFVKLIRLFDFNNVDNNEFIVSKQVWFRRAGGDKIKADIVLFINGIPVAIIECKNPANPNLSWFDAYRQIKEYERKVPDLFKYVQFSIAACRKVKYWANTPWIDEDIKHEWREEGIDDPVKATVVGMLSKNRLLDLIENFIFMKSERGREFKIIARYMQYRATNKIVKRVIDNLKGETTKDRGLIWHWQGSGKTLTMVFTSYKLQRLKLLENPTIIIVVDRRDLEEQLYGEFTSVGLSVERIRSIPHLIEVFTHDEGRGKRGIFLTLIQKFRRKDIKEFEKKVGKKIVIERRNVVVLVDEAHRSQYGSLAIEMRRILKNAFFFAFTGTPIKVAGRDTFRVFSYPDDDKGYMDRYFIKESIEDGFTLPIHYQPRLPKDVHLKKHELRFFLEQELFEEIPERFRGRVEKSIRERLNNIKIFLKKPERIEDVVKDIASHFKYHVEPLGFKAMIVTVDREACVLYKKALDEFLPPEYSEIVMTFTNTDPKVIADYRETLYEKYGRRDDNDIRKEVIRRFKEEELPKILIVTDMLLTGFDAPILQVMYLDKPLKGHRLLQAIARTNRPYGELKKFGLVLDYVGIFTELKKALEEYNTYDVKDVAYDAALLKERFKELIGRTLDMFKDIERRDDRETLMRVVRKFVKEGIGEEFEKRYKELRTLFELLAPDPFLDKYIDDYRWLTQLYNVYVAFVKRGDLEELRTYISKAYKKTLKYIYNSIDIGKIKNDFPILKLDENYLVFLDKYYPSLDVKVANLVLTIREYATSRARTNPIYKSIVEQVEETFREWKNGILETKNAYSKLVSIVKKCLKLERKRKEIGLSEKEYALLNIFRKYVSIDEYLLARRVKSLLQLLHNKGLLFNGWSTLKKATKDVEREVRLFIVRNFKGLTMNSRNNLTKEVMDLLKTYFS